MSISNRFWRFIGDRIIHAYDDSAPTDGTTPATPDSPDSPAATVAVGSADGSDAPTVATSAVGSADGNDPAATPAAPVAVGSADGNPAPIDVACRLFDLLSLHVDWEDDDGVSRAGHFQYQDGQFVIRVWNAHPYAQITMPAVFSADMRDIDLVRNMVNRVNMEALFVRMIITTNGQDNQAYCHAMTFVQMDAATDSRLQNMRDALTACFIARRDLTRYYDEGKVSGVEDPQLDDAHHRRDIHLMGEQAWLHDERRVQVYPDGPNRFTIKAMLRYIFDWHDVMHVRMRQVSGTEVSVVDDALDYEPLSALVSEGGAVLASDAVLLLDVERAAMQAFDDEPLLGVNSPTITVTAMLRVLASDDVTVFVRVTLAREGMLPGDMPTYQHPALEGDAVTFTIAYDKLGHNGRVEEFDYVMNEAIDKVSQNKDDELTDVQEMLLANEVGYNAAYHLYWGSEYERARRYAEALTHYINVYESQRADLPTMSARRRNAFYDIMYHVGLCYARLGQTERAYFYLEEVCQRVHNQVYLVELINCLVNVTDPRAESVLNQVTNHTQERMNEDDDDIDTDSLQSFLTFLHMRRAYLYVSQQRWDEAESLLNQLAKDDDTRQFALHELAYMATVKQSGKKKL